MANFNGTWKFVSRENNERILELMGCPWEMRKKIMLGIEKVKSVCKWDISTTTLVITTKVLDLKSEVQMKIGDPYLIGPHAPGLTGIIHAMSDEFLKGKIRDRSGEEIGTWESIIDGRLMTTKTTIKGEKSTIVMKKTK